MPPDNDSDDLFDGESTDDTAGSGSPQDPPAPQDDASGAGTPDSKRISDLMSKWQSAEAKATRLENELARRKTAGTGDRNSGGPTAKPGDEWLDFQRTMVRDSLFNSDPRLKTYGIDAAAIGGATPQEMKANFDRQVALIDKIETAARDVVLREHGLVPEIVAGTAEREDAPDFSRMSKKEFEEYLAQRGITL